MATKITAARIAVSAGVRTGITLASQPGNIIKMINGAVQLSAAACLHDLVVCHASASLPLVAMTLRFVPTCLSTLRWLNVRLFLFSTAQARRSARGSSRRSGRSRAPRSGSRTAACPLASSLSVRRRA
jgi:hypothetical protein